MNRFLFSTFFLSYSLLLASCSFEPDNSKNIQDDSNLEADSIKNSKAAYFPVGVGMNYSEVKTRFPDCEFNFQNGSKYDIGVNVDGNEVVRDDEVLFFYWNHWNFHTVIGILLISPKCMLYDDICVGLTMKDILKEYPDATTFIDPTTGRESCEIKGIGYVAYFGNQKDDFMGEYDWKSNPEKPGFVKFKDSSGVIESIWLYK